MNISFLVIDLPLLFLDTWLSYYFIVVIVQNALSCFLLYFAMLFAVVISFSKLRSVGFLESMVHPKQPLYIQGRARVYVHSLLWDYTGLAVVL